MRADTNKKLHELFKDRELCLSGRKFTIEDRIGAGDKAVVYRIKDAVSNNEYAFTRWNNEYGTEYRGSFLVLARARKSKSRINMPLLVNKKEQYSMTPLMQGSLAREGSDFNQWRPQGDCDLLMREDGIFGAFDAHTRNYMYPAVGGQLLRAIDFRTFKKLEDVKGNPDMLSPKYISVPLGDAKRCLVE